eukprot:286261-Amphidinium_carterae.1
MTHDLEMNFNKIAPFGKEDTAKELQDHAAKTQDSRLALVRDCHMTQLHPLPSNSRRRRNHLLASM